MTPTSAVLFAVATELANLARDSLPEMREGEEICREWYDSGVYYRETSYKGKTFISQFDFRQRKSRQEAVGSG